MSVKANFRGRLGNNLFQYCFGRIVAEELGFAFECIPDKIKPVSASRIIDPKTNWRFFEFDWNRHFPNAPLSIPGYDISEPIERLFEITHPNVNLLRFILQNRQPRQIRLIGTFQRFEYYAPHRERILRWFKLQAPGSPLAISRNDVLVNIRRGVDFGMLGWTLPMSYYEGILSELPNIGKVYVCGTAVDEFVRQGLKKYEPVYLDGTPVEHLQVFQRFNRIILSNSTFSWWASFLSNAEEIYGPRSVNQQVYAFSGWPNADLNMRDARYREILFSETAPFGKVTGVGINNWERLCDPSDHDLLRWIGQQQGSVAIDLVRQKYGRDAADQVVQRLAERGLITVTHEYLG